MYYVSQELKSYFSKIPETGMGYQHIETRDLGGRNSRRPFIILNGEIAIETRGLESLLPGYFGFLLEDMELLYHWARHIDISDPMSLLNLGDEFPYTQKDIYPTIRNSYPSRTFHGEVLVRYSAFENDYRIDGSSISAGTYFTSQNDAMLIPSGMAAISRYALPNPVPAKHCFRVVFARSAQVVCGTVAPSYGQSGGGTEIRTLKRYTVREFDHSIIDER